MQLLHQLGLGVTESLAWAQCPESRGLPTQSVGVHVEMPEDFHHPGDLGPDSDVAAGPPWSCCVSI